MVRSYKKKTNRGEWSMIAMKTAIDKVISKEMGYKRAAALYDVPQSTLERYVRRTKEGCEGEYYLPLGPKKTIFTRKEEDEIVACLKESEESDYVLTTMELRTLAYQLAIKNDKKHNFNNEKKIAGVDWLNGFLKRHPTLTIREPDDSKMGSTKFNMHRVEKKVIADLLEMYKNLPCLWDVTDQFYSNKVARNRAYDTLIEKYKEVDSECNQQMLKKKIENLRSTYRRERQKVIKSKFRNGERYKPHLWYYSLFSFLEKLEHSSDEDSMYYESPDVSQAMPDKMAATESILQDERLTEMASTEQEMSDEVIVSVDIIKVEDVGTETARAAESILPNYEGDIGIMTVEPEPEIKYQAVKRLKPSAVYIPETEYDYESETTTKASSTKRRKKNRPKMDSTSTLIEDHEPITCLVESSHSSGFAESDLFAKTMSSQLSELRPKQRFIAQKLMSEVIFFGRLDKLRTETKLQLDDNN